MVPDQKNIFLSIHSLCKGIERRGRMRSSVESTLGYAGTAKVNIMNMMFNT